MLSPTDPKTSIDANQSIGVLKQYEKTSNGITGIADNGKFEVVVYSQSIIRIRLTKREEFDDHSYAVIATPDLGEYEIIESPELIVISTKIIDLQIFTDPLRFTFKNKDGVVLNEDDEAFGTSWIGSQVTCYKKLQEGERFVGLGEKTGDLDKFGSGYVNWNTDNFGYSSKSDPLYCSTPFYIGIHHEVAYGIYLDNSYKSYFNFGASNNRFSSFGADCGDLDYYFIHQDSVAGIIESYTYLTGRMELPPIWSLGYQQCRYSYYPDKEVLSIAETFRYKDIPADAIVLDIHYMDNYKIFTWDKERFPDPKSMIDKLGKIGFKIVVMCDPGIKVEDGYHAYEDGKKNDVFLKYPDGTYYTGEVWPGWCHFPDFTNKNTRKWWAKMLKVYIDLGVEGFWNDMNEIATWGNMLPELIEFDFEGKKGNTRKGRNIYGLMMSKSSYEGAKKQLNGKRPFCLTRSAFSGIQRYSAVWTGDNVASEEHMLMGVRLVNSLGLTGIPFTGYDVGGFVGDASVDLFARWLTIGAFSPFFRGHSMVNSRDSEPWSYGEKVEEISRNYIKLRYKLLPYIYSVFYEATQNGLPICRSLAIDYSFDPKVYDEKFQNQYLFGPSILIAPIKSGETITRVYLPEGKWFNMHTGKVMEGDQELLVESPVEKLPIFIRTSAIIPMQSPVSFSEETPDDTLMLHVYCGNKDVSFIYYEDDGKSYNYQSGEFYSRELIYTPDYLKLEAVDGMLNSKFKYIELIFHGLISTNHVIEINGQKNTLKSEEITFLEPITQFNPRGNGGTVKGKDVLTTKIENTRDQIIISWEN